MILVAPAQSQSKNKITTRFGRRALPTEGWPGRETHEISRTGIVTGRDRRNENALTALVTRSRPPSCGGPVSTAERTLKLVDAPGRSKALAQPLRRPVRDDRLISASSRGFLNHLPTLQHTPASPVRKRE